MHRPSILALAAIVSLGSGPCPLAGGQKAEGRPPAVHSPGRPETEARTAPDSGSSTPIDEFDRLSPEEQQQKLARLPADQRRRLEERLRQFNQLPFEQRQMLRNLYSRLHQLAPGQQATVHKAIDRFSKQPAESQQAIRDELRLLSALPEQDRAARVTSRDFRQGLTRKEQGIVRDMLPLLPLS
jgi:hypothetical protein